MVNSLHFSSFGVIKKKKQKERRRKEKIKVWKNQTINPFFFLMNLGLKEPYLVYL